jgi:hypothetical protein
MSLNAPIAEQHAASTIKPNAYVIVTTNKGQKLHLRVIAIRDGQLVGLHGSDTVAIDLNDIASIEGSRRFRWMPYAITGAAVLSIVLVRLLVSVCGGKNGGC